MKEPKDLLFPKGFSELDDLKKNDMPRPKLKEEEELTPIEVFNNKLGELFKINSKLWYSNSQQLLFYKK